MTWLLVAPAPRRSASRSRSSCRLRHRHRGHRHPHGRRLRRRRGSARRGRCLRRRPAVLRLRRHHRHRAPHDPACRWSSPRLGATLIARETDAGTNVLVWTQGITRRRWLSPKIAFAVVAALVVAAVVERARHLVVGDTELARRQPLPGRGVRHPEHRAGGGRALRGGDRARGRCVAPAGRARPGVVDRCLRRGPDADGGLPATALHDAEHEARSSRTATPHVPSGSWTLMRRLLDPRGHVVADGRVAVPKGCSSAGVRDALGCLGKLGYRDQVRFHPASHYWQFQWTEAALFVDPRRRSADVRLRPHRAARRLRRDQSQGHVAPSAGVTPVTRYATTATSTHTLPRHDGVAVALVGEQMTGHERVRQRPGGPDRGDGIAEVADDEDRWGALAVDVVERVRDHRRRPQHARQLQHQTDRAEPPQRAEPRDTAHRRRGCRSVGDLDAIDRVVRFELVVVGAVLAPPGVAVAECQERLAVPERRVRDAVMSLGRSASPPYTVSTTPSSASPRPSVHRPTARGCSCSRRMSTSYTPAASPPEWNAHVVSAVQAASSARSVSSTSSATCVSVATSSTASGRYGTVEHRARRWPGNSSAYTLPR